MSTSSAETPEFDPLTWVPDSPEELEADPFLNPDRTVPTTYRPQDFDLDVIDFCRAEPFLGTILANITRALDYNARTAGYIMPRKFGKLWTFFTAFDPWRMQAITQKERQGIIEHELYHLIAGHLTHRVGVGKKHRRLYNIAMDLAINSLINDQAASNAASKGHLPRKYVFIPGSIPKGIQTLAEAEFFRNLPKLLPSEVYFDLLLKFQNEQQKNKKNKDDEDEDYGIFPGVQGIDDHDVWDQLPDEVQDLLRQKMRGLIEKGVRNADSSNSWGSVPKWMIEDLRRMVSGEIDWRAVLRWFLGSARSPTRTSTVKRINKRMPYIMPGSKRLVQKDFVCFIDQSGSMSDEDISLLFAELSQLANFSEIDTYHFDTAVDETSHQIWNRSNPYPRTLRTRCGGTNFNAVANFINEKGTRNKKWSGIIILTDGYAPTMGHISHGKVLWVITPTGSDQSVRPQDLVIKMTKDGSNKVPGIKI